MYKIVDMILKSVYNIHISIRIIGVLEVDRLKDDRTIWKSLMMITQIGISMITPIFLAGYLGLKMDAWLTTNYWFIIWLILGIMAAFRNVYALTKRFYSKDLKRELEKQKYFEDLKKARSQKGKEK
ncbi:MAG: synthase protein [Clostridiales bacterium]|nr:synthase protein [Clostridiales bacterium]